MNDWILLGLNRWMIPIPPVLWRRMVANNAAGARQGLAFMTEDHHRVRDLVVSAMPGGQGPISPEAIAERLGLPSERVMALLDELEARMTFLYRGNGRDVTWAYPMTSDQTPHRLEFDSGAQANAA